MSKVEWVEWTLRCAQQTVFLQSGLPQTLFRTSSVSYLAVAVEVSSEEEAAVDPRDHAGPKTSFTVCMSLLKISTRARPPSSH